MVSVETVESDLRDRNITGKHKTIQNQLKLNAVVVCVPGTDPCLTCNVTHDFVNLYVCRVCTTTPVK